MGATHGGDGALKMPSLIVPTRFALALLLTNSTAPTMIENVARFIILGPFLVDDPRLKTLRRTLQPSQTRNERDLSPPADAGLGGSLPTPLAQVKKLVEE
jgi:hypothetical protein